MLRKRGSKHGPLLKKTFFLKKTSRANKIEISGQKSRRQIQNVESGIWSHFFIENMAERLSNAFIRFLKPGEQKLESKLRPW